MTNQEKIIIEELEKLKERTERVINHAIDNIKNIHVFEPTHQDSDSAGDTKVKSPLK